MSRVMVFFAEGHEEIEALTVVDLLRRAGIKTDMVSVTGSMTVTGSHGITETVDALIEDVDFDEVEMLVLPGGMPGTKNLEANELLMSKVDEFVAADKYIAAICAAPTVFGHRGILKGRKACCYPGMQDQLEGANVSYDNVAVDGKVITSRGLGTAIDFALTIISELMDKETAEKIGTSVVYNR